MTAAGWGLLAHFNSVVLGYFVVLNSFYLATSLAAFMSLRIHARRLQALDLEDLMRAAGIPAVTILVPMRDEELNGPEVTASLLRLDYPSFEVIVVNDGSADRTFDRLEAAFALAPVPRAPTAAIPTAEIRGVYQSRKHPNLWVIDKENGGKADAINVGLNVCRTPFFCVVDSDSLLEPDALKRIVRPFLADGSTVACGGIIRIVNGSTVTNGAVSEVRLPRNLLARFQVLEYLRAFLVGRVGWGVFEASLIISGAFGVFRRSAVVEAGGYDVETVGEDMEMVIRLHRRLRERGATYRIHFVPDPVAWTACPEGLLALGRQRARWQCGMLESLWKHIGMLGRPRYGRIGLVAFPYVLLMEAFGPLIEILGYAGFAAAVVCGRASAEYVAAFFLLAIAFGTTLSIASVALEEIAFRRYTRFSDLLRLLVLAVAENFGYRQMMTYWRVHGIVSFFLGGRTWGRVDRSRFRSQKAV